MQRKIDSALEDPRVTDLNKTKVDKIYHLINIVLTLHNREFKKAFKDGPITSLLLLSIIVILLFGKVLLPLLFPDLGHSLKDLALELRKSCVEKIDNKNPALHSYSHQQLQGFCNSFSLATAEFLYHFFREFIPNLLFFSLTITLMVFFKMWFPLILSFSLILLPIIEIKMAEKINKKNSKAASSYNQILSFQDRLMKLINWFFVNNKTKSIEEALFSDKEGIYMSKIDGRTYSQIYTDHIQNITDMSQKVSEEMLRGIFKAIPIYFLLFSGVFIAASNIKFHLADVVGLSIFAILVLSEASANLVHEYYKCSTLFAEIDMSKQAIESIPDINKNLSGIQITDIEKIEFSNVTKSYTEKQEDEIFTPISFKAEAGKPIIFKAPSGSGKSTIFSMIKGFLRPTRGEITLTVTDIYGKRHVLDISEINLPSLWNLLLEFTADMENFNISIGSLLKMANPSISEEQMNILIETCSLNKLIEDAGYNHLLSQCSAGQKDRIKLSLMLNKDSFLNILEDKDLSNKDVFTFVETLKANNFHLDEKLKMAYPDLSEKFTKIKEIYKNEYQGYLFLLFNLKGKLVCLDEAFGHIDDYTALRILKNLEKFTDKTICFVADHSGIVKENLPSTEIVISPLKSV
jgi:ABC-type multidrug transport system fused ATPase/permease subunit